MFRFRIVPLSNWIIIIALVILSILSLAPKVDAATCGPWQTRTVHVFHPVWGSGRAGFAAGYRYNNCRAEGLWINPEGFTTLSSVKYTWKGFYRAPGSTSIQAGVNYTVCMLPIKGIGPCWDEYMRLTITRTGARSYSGNGMWPVMIQ